jgi:hypothetical protein
MPYGLGMQAESITTPARSLAHTVDRVAIALSGLCVLHCVGTAVLLALFSSIGGELLHPAVHEVGLAAAVALASVALGRGIVAHGRMMPASVGGLGLGTMAGALALPHGPGEMLATILGVSLVALGHDLNRRAAR